MKIINKIFTLIALVLVLGSCNLDEINNPNGPTQEAYLDGASLSQLQLLTTGLESVIRNDMEFYYQTVSIVGREYYDLNGTDPRYTGELLGAGEGENVLDNNGFLTTRSFAARYRSVRNAENLLTAVANSDAGLDAAGIAGFNSFAKTMKAYELLLTLNRQYNNGIRLETSDPDNLGPFVSYEAGLDGISSLLAEAASDAANAGNAFAFTLSSGFTGFDTPATFSQFIHGLKARVDMYRNDKTAVMAALNESFVDESGDLSNGVYHVFSGAGNDRLNPLFYALEQNRYMAHPTFVSDAESGDSRLSKIADLGDPVMIDGLSSPFQVQLYASNTSPAPIIRNEELVLLMAEAQIGTNNARAVELIDVVRSAAGLSAYAGGTDDDSLVDEVLHQRRYSLFGEGHRWIDMRRYDRLDDLPLDRSGDQVFVQFPRPILEPN